MTLEYVLCFVDKKQISVFSFLAKGVRKNQRIKEEPEKNFQNGCFKMFSCSLYTFIFHLTALRNSNSTQFTFYVLILSFHRDYYKLKFKRSC